MIPPLLRIIYCVHIRCDLIDLPLIFPSSIFGTPLRLLLLLYHLLPTTDHLLVVSVDLEYVFGDSDEEFALNGLWQVLGDVPFGHHLLIRRGVSPSTTLSDATVVVDVLEEKDTPVVRRGQTQEGEERLLLDRVDHEIHEILCLIKSSPLSVNDNFVEVSIDDIATELFETIE